MKSARIKYVFLAFGLWLSVFFLVGTTHPYDYDSVNYALAVEDGFDIRKCQPHAPGYLYHVLVVKALHPIVSNPFVLQQIISLLYLSLFLFVVASQVQNSAELFGAITSPLILLFCCTPVIHGVHLAFSALIAYFVHQTMERRVSPLVLGFVFFASTGFRPDLGIFMGPVFLYALYLRRCSKKEWLLLVLMGLAIYLSWYLPAKYLSGGISPSEETRKLNYAWFRSASVFWGASPFQHLRSAVRFVIYAPAVWGPGGILLACLTWTRLARHDKLILLVATLPFVCYGLFIYLAHPNYYATIIGFTVVWLFLRGQRLAQNKIVWAAVAANLLLFWLMPVPQWERSDEFKNRSFFTNVKRQVLYLGAAGSKRALAQRSAMGFAERHLAGLECFRVRDEESLERMLGYLAKYRWGNQLVKDPKGGCATVGIVRPGEIPDMVHGNLGIWSGEPGEPNEVEVRQSQANTLGQK